MFYFCNNVLFNCSQKLKRMAEKLFLTVSASALNLFELFNETNFKFQILFRIYQAIMRELYTAEKNTI
jgi:hypothetical protein